MSARLWRRDGARIWLENYITDFSAHGIFRLTATAGYLPGIVRVLWSLLFVAALSYSLRQCVVLINRYRENGVDVSVDFSFGKETAFPAVTICNLNALRTSAVLKSRFHVPQKTTTNNGSSGSGTPSTTGTTPIPTTTTTTPAVPTTPPAVITTSSNNASSTNTPSPDVCVVGLLVIPKPPGLSCSFVRSLFSGPAVGNFTNPFDTGSSASQVLMMLGDLNNSTNSSVFDLNVQKADSTRHAVNLDVTQPPVIRQEIETIGHQLNDMLISCQWEGRPCSASDFTQFQNGEYGNCYTFNSGKNRSVLSTNHVGPTNGLIVELDVEQAKEYIGTLTEPAGFRLTLHRQGEVPFPEDDGFNIPPSHSTYIGIRQVVIDRKGPPYSNCQTSQSDSSGTLYTKPNCLKTCLAEEMFSRCGCVQPNFINFNYSLCHVTQRMDQRQCLDDVTQLFSEDRLCNSCPDPCRRLVYQKTLSLERWPAKSYEYLLEEKLAALNKTIYDDKGNDFRGEYARLVVYFEEFNYQVISERPAVEVVGLLSSIGGTLGLYVGLSVLSLVEFIDVFLNMIYFLWIWLSHRILFK